MIGRVTIGARASVWFGAVLRGDFDPIRVGAESLIEDNAVLHGRVVVGRRCVIGHGAVLHGCTVGDDAVIGANAIVFDGARVGAGSAGDGGIRRLSRHPRPAAHRLQELRRRQPPIDRADRQPASAAGKRPPTGRSSRSTARS